MPAIPVAIEQMKTILNLNELSNEQMFSDFEFAVKNYLEKNTTSDSYQFALGDKASEKLNNSFKLAYSFLMLSFTAEFLNLNTAGNGIVTSTGFDNHQTNLMSGNELRKFKRDLEIKALKVLEPYLNDNGIKLLNQFENKQVNSSRGCII